MSIDGQCTKWRRNIAENFNRLSRVHQRYRQTTDGRTMTYSEHELEFTFAKNSTSHWPIVLKVDILLQYGFSDAAAENPLPVKFQTADGAQIGHIEMAITPPRIV